jgi:uncharacterized protein
MQDGADVIYQGALLDAPWHGYADFLIRVNGKTRLGKHGYEVADTKLARRPQPKHVLQLCVYSRLLAAVQGNAPENVHLVLGDKSQVSFQLSQFVHYAELAQRRLEAFAAKPPRESFGEPCGHCVFCRWQEHCGSEWDRVDHLCRVANISKSQIAKLKVAGIDSMRRLASLPVGEAVADLHRETLARLRQQANLQDHKRRTGENRCKLLPPLEGKGFARLPKPDAGDLFFDMEGDPLADGGLEYLFGFAFAEEPGFRPFWGHSREEEKRAFEAAVDFIVARIKRHPLAYIYQYAAYEESALKRLSVLHGTREAEVDDLLRGHKLVDLYKVVREGLRVSEPSYSIKNLETFYMEKREGDVKGGGESIVVYEQWREVGDPALLKQIEDYNATDCRSTLLLRDWLLTLRPKEAAWFAPPPPEPEDAKKLQARTEAQVRLDTTTARLLDGVSEKEKPFRELVSQLLEFHRREAKPQYWMMFHRQEMADDELIDDADCIGALSRDPKRKPVADKQSQIHYFRFPPQDFKLREGERPLRADTLKGAGEIWELDEDVGTIALRVGNSVDPFPETFSLIPGGPIDTTVIREAIYRYAGAVVANKNRYPAITSFLKKKVPAVEGIASGAPLIAGATTLQKAVNVIAGLRNCQLIVQGPPGAGKTFTASHAIVELLAQGKRVGVSSNSHKAVITLLKGVEEVALKRKLKFRGVKKGSGGDDRLDGKIIEDVADNKKVVEGNYQLIAGTAWLFARDELDQTLDYVFIDEAGQVSLANVMAIGTSAKNIVLIGDQMQLAQPTQGVHPGDSGLSALEYLLGEHATVPPENGIFLDRTYRMHPDVCRFISDAFYDGRLKSEAGNERQRLVLSAKADAALAPTGLRFVEVEHSGCSQASEPEAGRVAAVYREILKQRWVDKDGNNAAIKAADILVVSPYNMQVNLLKQALGDAARVGTVDKFQGQEAAVVLVSMATSSADDMPRNIEFLFSRNRLNVAVSRARCLAVIFANPRLLETPCSTIEQLRLVNTLCRAKVYADCSLS